MPLPRRTYFTMLDDASFSVETPMNYFDADALPMPASFDAPDTWATLLKMDCALETSWIALYGRPIAEGCVLHWLQQFASQHNRTTSDITQGTVGGLLHHHPALHASGKMMLDDQRIDLSIAAFEDGGRAFVVVAAATEHITADFLPTLELCIRTIELDQPAGPTLPLMPQADAPTLDVIEHDPNRPLPRDSSEVWQRQMERRRDEAMQAAAPLLKAGRFDEMEQAIRAADDSIMGAVAIGRAYTDALSAMVASGAHRKDKARAEALFERALRWRQSAYPEPHTAIEAKDNERGRADDRQALIAILGYDPTAK